MAEINTAVVRTSHMYAENIPYSVVEELADHIDFLQEVLRENTRTTEQALKRALKAEQAYMALANGLKDEPHEH